MMGVTFGLKENYSTQLALDSNGEKSLGKGEGGLPQEDEMSSKRVSTLRYPCNRPRPKNRGPCGLSHLPLSGPDRDLRLSLVSVTPVKVESRQPPCEPSKIRWEGYTFPPRDSTDVPAAGVTTAAICFSNSTSVAQTIHPNSCDGKLNGSICSSSGGRDPTEGNLPKANDCTPSGEADDLWRLPRASSQPDSRSTMTVTSTNTTRQWPTAPLPRRTSDWSSHLQSSRALPR